ncbi:PREDICTED: somatomedin-B and thrombospondin type-1 domain-containing protein-like [Odobenus rosmarus divergens]|uniref:Somatomedin-B and thrombospondin type-1 domain-containing protein-like n=1 Tax=Odobenus rosmarus divergens TaxID=9708 RepID=A0A2U3WT82_ODORO|nr:PREDICTED: somatomedin-B and thrombospondin type-1 domain-containing protein-like [Odobenus rosmarus divergens]
MTLRSAARILPLALALAVVSEVSWGRRPSGVLWPGQGCAALGRCCPGSDPTCVARGPPRCFCDQACDAVPDCSPDYSRVSPGSRAGGVVGTSQEARDGEERRVGLLFVVEWNGWSCCVKPCQISYRIRRRRVLPEPRNGCAPRRPLEEPAGCVDYRGRQRVECQQPLLPALITTGSYGNEQKKRGVPKEQETVLLQFLLGPIPESRQQVRAPHAQWTRYLTQGHTVCVRCEWPAPDARNQRCYGDVGGAGGNQLLQWQAAGHPRCQGTWERLRQLRDCSCPEVHSLVFI